MLGSAPINGVAVPFAGQPVQGFSAALPAGDGRYRVMPDNGYGSIENSADFRLQVYLLEPRPKTEWGGPGTIAVKRFIELRDPDGRIPFAIVNAFTAEPVLTGADFDIESMQRDRHGTLWFGDEFGPFLLHTDADGRVLHAPYPLPDSDHPDQEVRASQNPLSEESSTLRVMNAMSADARAHGDLQTPIVSPDANLLDDGDPTTGEPTRQAPPAGSGLAPASSELINVASLHRAGYKVVPYTVNDVARMKALIKLGVDGIITDRPDLLRAIVDGDPSITPGFDIEGHRGARNLRPENTLPAFGPGQPRHHPGDRQRHHRGRRAGDLARPLRDGQQMPPRGRPALRDQGRGAHPLADPGGVAVTVRLDRDDHGNRYVDRTIGPDPFVDKVGGVIERNDLQDRAFVQSFDWRTLRAVASAFPELQTVELFGDFPVFADASVAGTDDGTNLQPQGTESTTRWLGGLSWPYRHTAQENPFRAQTSGGFEGMALSHDGRELLPMLEKPLAGAPPQQTQIYTFDLRRRSYTGERWTYPYELRGESIGDFQMADRRRGLVIERDNTQGDLGGFKALEAVTLGQPGTTVAKRPAADLMNLADPGGISQPGADGDVGLGDPFAFPFQRSPVVPTGMQPRFRGTMRG